MRMKFVPFLMTGLSSRGPQLTSLVCLLAFLSLNHGVQTLKRS